MPLIDKAGEPFMLDTLDEPADAGRLRTSDDVKVVDNRDGTVRHDPPSCTTLPAMCHTTDIGYNNIKPRILADRRLSVWWWRITEPNPRPISEQKSVRKNAVPILNHLAVFADIGQNGWTVRLAEFDAVTGSRSRSETSDAMATIVGNAVALN